MKKESFRIARKEFMGGRLPLWPMPSAPEARVRGYHRIATRTTRNA